MTCALRHWPRPLLLAAGLLAGAARAWAAPTEFDLKAVFLFHFAQFVAWPDTAFAGPNAPFVIGVAGQDPFGATLANVVRGESMGGHPLVVQHVDSVAAARRCQILYVAPDGDSRFPAQSLAGAPVLTVGESATFFQSGGIIQFFTDHNHVRLRVNLTAARADSLTISAKLLRVAEVEGAQ